MNIKQLETFYWAAKLGITLLPTDQYRDWTSAPSTRPGRSPPPTETRAARAYRINFGNQVASSGLVQSTASAINWMITNGTTPR